MESTLQTRLKEARKTAKMSQAVVAEKVGMSQPNYSDLERGEVKSTTLLPQIAFVLGVRPYWLATGEGPRSEEELLDIDERELVSAWRTMSTESKRVVMTQFRALRNPAADAPGQ